MVLAILEIMKLLYFQHIAITVVFGEDFVLNKPFSKLAEGIYTMQALLKLADKHHVELPICAVINEIVINHKNPKEEFIKFIFVRPLKAE